MRLEEVDPSLALGLLVRDAQDLTELVAELRRNVLPRSTPQLFELLDVRPDYLPPFIAYPSDSSPNPVEYAMVEPRYDTDEEFEMLSS